MQFYKLVQYLTYFPESCCFFIFVFFAVVYQAVGVRFCVLVSYWRRRYVQVGRHCHHHIVTQRVVHHRLELALFYGPVVFIFVAFIGAALFRLLLFFEFA